MILDWLTNNLSTLRTLLELIMFIGGGLFLLGKMKADYSTFQKARLEKEQAMANQIAELKKDNEHLSEQYRQHLAENTPHKSCAVETSNLAGLAANIVELRKAITRVEGWVMALAAKQNIKEPSNGY